MLFGGGEGRDGGLHSEHRSVPRLLTRACCRLDPRAQVHHPVPRTHAPRVRNISPIPIHNVQPYTQNPPRENISRPAGWRLRRWPSSRRIRRRCT